MGTDPHILSPQGIVENSMYRVGPIRTQYARFDSMLPSAPRSALITNKDRGPCIWIATCASSCCMRIMLCNGEGNHWDSMNSVYLRVIYLIISYMLWGEIYSTCSTVSQIQRLLHTSIIQGSFTDTSHSNKTHCSFMTTHKVSLDNPK